MTMIISAHLGDCILIASDKRSMHCDLETGNMRLATNDEQKMVCDSIVGQKLSVRETEKLVKELKEKDIEKPKKDKPKDAYNYTPLNNIVEKLKENNLKVKVEKNYFKIEFNSQEEVDRIISYFNIQS